MAELYINEYLPVRPTGGIGSLPWFIEDHVHAQIHFGEVQSYFQVNRTSLTKAITTALKDRSLLENISRVVVRSLSDLNKKKELEKMQEGFRDTEKKKKK